MWTPKRMLLLAAGFGLFFAAYVVYAHFLGGIDGLPPLPPGYGPVANPNPILPFPQAPETSTDAKLRKAFGDECDELKRKIRLELQKGVVLATQDIVIREDGLVELTPFSVAIFGKDHGDGKAFPEINTVRSDKAVLTLDKPVKNILELGNSKSKVVRGELLGDVYVVNNRRTPQRDDDVSLYTRGPLLYEENRNLIWTTQPVLMTDLQSKPQPMTIYGTGMALQLATGTKPGKGSSGEGKPRSQAVTGLDRIDLPADVEMHLWVDAHSGFVGADRPSQPARARPAAGPAKEPGPAEKAKVVILCPGPFSYDVHTDRATFDISHNASRRASNNIIKVSRLNEKEGKLDELSCEHLELQFQRKNSGTQADDRPEGLDIETAWATGKEVIVISDAEVLEAHSRDFFYDKRVGQSTLKGNPMWAIKEGNQIEAPELQLSDRKGAQQATALGQGQIRMFDKTTGKYSLTAQWKQKLVYAKEGVQDVLVLVGTASFADSERGQQLRADLLKVWLNPAEPANGSESGQDLQRRKPSHVLAVGHVTARSPELQAHDTEHLEVFFRDVPPSALPPAGAPKSPAAGKAAEPPARPSEGRGAKDEGRAPHPSPPAPRAAPVPGRGGPSQQPAATATTEPAKKQPLDLSARSIRVTVLRADTRTDLDKVYCEGVVRVFQEPASPQEKGVDIRGETLEMTHHVDGNVLVVTGGGVSGDHARVQIRQLLILGPVVNIDQTTNEVWVNGLGAMRLPSKANLDGSSSARESELTIYWEKRMHFNGQQAEFLGTIRAEQDDGHLACQEMQVTLDRRVSLREEDKSGPSPKVEKLVCDKEVWVEETKREAGQVVLSRRIDCQQLDMDNDNESQETIVRAAGWGTVRLFQLGTDEPGQGGQAGPGQAGPGQARRGQSPRTPAGRGQPPQAQAGRGQPPRGAAPPSQTQRGRPQQGQADSKDEPETKLTYVSFQGRMQASNKKGIATFYDNIVVIHVPTTDSELPINESQPPQGAMYMRCEKLEVHSRKLDDNLTTHEMRAYHKVFVEAQEFSGRADVVKYDESKDDQIIFEGSDGNPAVLYKQKGPGQDRDEIRAMKIIYWRKTGQFKEEGGQSIRGTTN